VARLEHVIDEELLKRLPKTAFISVAHSEALTPPHSQVLDLGPSNQMESTNCN
jgi:ABC-type uncharacterized transport system fused permease/ATPase subunit